MNMVAKALLIGCLAFTFQAADARGSASVGSLLSHLTQLHDRCAQLAKNAATQNATAEYKLALDLSNAQEQAQMDAQVYGVGHGSRETNEYLIQRMQDAQTANDQAEMKIRKAYQDDAQAVTSCVQQSEAEGKAAYSDFKAQKRVSRATKAEAESLMTAWLTNLDEITVNTPQGSSATAAQWKTAKAHAELVDL